MTEVRACVYLLVLLVTFQRTLGSPYGTDLWCSLFCDEYDDDDDDFGFDFDDILAYFFNFCGECEKRPAAAAPASESSAAPAASSEAPNVPGTGAKPQKINLSIPPANGVNLTLENSGTWWWLNLVPWVGGGSATTEAPAAATTTPAGNATAANATAA